MLFVFLMINMVQLEEVFAHAMKRKVIMSKRQMLQRQQLHPLLSLTHVLRQLTELDSRCLELYMMNVGGT